MVCALYFLQTQALKESTWSGWNRTLPIFGLRYRANCTDLGSIFPFRPLGEPTKSVIVVKAERPGYKSTMSASLLCGFQEASVRGDLTNNCQLASLSSWFHTRTVHNDLEGPPNAEAPPQYIYYPRPFALDQVAT